ncbi:dormancy-associated protein homolog 3 isoform X3 [Gossypium hirsutum]|uniref:Dormancy-associated protein homolog 3 isoform X3 n=1 Tax=Gossypium hirsutum TaxID=3635 RepID=A0A1U8PQU7_GOSHI|nr:dormancy-associated protein homolog 3-like isoform X3 [Gossypium hirsutum]
MGLLGQLWDDSVAGPRPDTGLGKLRKQSKFTFWPNSAKESDGGSVRSNGDETSLEEATRVTRTIMIVKPPGYQTGSPPVSPAGTTPPQRIVSVPEKIDSDAYEKAGEVGARSPHPP